MRILGLLVSRGRAGDDRFELTLSLDSPDDRAWLRELMARRFVGREIQRIDLGPDVETEPKAATPEGTWRG